MARRKLSERVQQVNIQDAQQKEFLLSKEIYAIYGISYRKLSQMRENGLVKARQLGMSRAYYYKKTELDKAFRFVD